MKKKIGDLTLREVKEICYEHTDYFGRCNKSCPLTKSCCITKHIRCIPTETLNQEIEVEDNENI